MPAKSVLSVAGVTTELTAADLARKKAESDAMFLSIGEGAVVIDQDGRISRINQAGLDILGFGRDDLLGAWYPATVIAEDENGIVIPNIERPITQVFMTGRPVSRRLYYRRKDGTKVATYMTVSPVILEGKPIGAVEVFRDITKEVELEKAKDEFISLASHQLRTPASAVKQYAGMFVQGYAGQLTEQQQVMAEAIYECNEREIAIINDLLRVAQVDAGKVNLQTGLVDITSLLRQVVDEQADKFAARSQTVRLLGMGHAALVHVDVRHMRMVFENIIDNASKYTPNDKAISVSVRIGRRFLSVAIRDQGVGIAAKDIPQIFRKFSRIPNKLSDTVGGTGLGLYWAKRIVDLHGGTIKIASKPEKGTTFTVQIPLQPLTRI